MLTFRQANQIPKMIVFEKAEPSMLQSVGHLDLAKDIWITLGKMYRETRLEDFDAAVAEIERLSLDKIYGLWDRAEMMSDAPEQLGPLGVINCLIPISCLCSHAVFNDSLDKQKPRRMDVDDLTWDSVLDIPARSSNVS
jgi:hypothetical protein